MFPSLLFLPRCSGRSLRFLISVLFLHTILPSLLSDLFKVHSSAPAFHFPSASLPYSGQLSGILGSHNITFLFLHSSGHPSIYLCNISQACFPSWWLLLYTKQQSHSWLEQIMGTFFKGENMHAFPWILACNYYPLRGLEQSEEFKWKHFCCLCCSHTVQETELNFLPNLGESHWSNWVKLGHVHNSRFSGPSNSRLSSWFFLQQNHGMYCVHSALSLNLRSLHLDYNSKNGIYTPYLKGFLDYVGHWESEPNWHFPLIFWIWPVVHFSYLWYFTPFSFQNQTQLKPIIRWKEIMEANWIPFSLPKSSFQKMQSSTALGIRDQIQKNPSGTGPWTVFLIPWIPSTPLGLK